MADINGDGISDLLGFHTKEGSSSGSSTSANEGGTSLFCRAGVFKEDIHTFRFHPCEQHFPTPKHYQPGFTTIFTDLDCDLGTELALWRWRRTTTPTGSGGGWLYGRG